MSTPMTFPSMSARGPPDCPGWMSASVAMRPVRSSESPVDWSLAVMERPRAVIAPEATVGIPPRPPAFPIPTTDWPTVAVFELPMLTVLSPFAPVSLITAMSWLRS